MNFNFNLLTVAVKSTAGLGTILLIINLERWMLRLGDC